MTKAYINSKIGSAGKAFIKSTLAIASVSEKPSMDKQAKENYEGQRLNIIWSDSRLYITQIDINDLDDYAEIESIGFCVQDRSGSITLAGDKVDKEFRRVLVIPKANIITIQKL